jgi:hypothetical protein
MKTGLEPKNNEGTGRKSTAMQGLSVENCFWKLLPGEGLGMRKYLRKVLYREYILDVDVENISRSSDIEQIGQSQSRLAKPGSLEHTVALLENDGIPFTSVPSLEAHYSRIISLPLSQLQT